MNFEEYLVSKKIDSVAFRAHEPALWESWKEEFEHVHPTSFTSQKLYLINPLRRKYQLTSAPIPEKAVPPAVVVETQEASKGADAPEVSKPLKPAIPKPVFKPKPKMN